jgi:four helix bundle protein
VSNYRRLTVWQRAQALSIAVHIAAREFPSQGAPGLRSQLLRAIAAIPANLAEGAGQGSDVHYLKFVDIAIGSANEAENHLDLVSALEFLPDAECRAYLTELDEVRRMLYGLRKSLLPLATRKSGAARQP